MQRTNFGRFSLALGVLGLMAITSGCSSAYYGAWERLGWAKRDILVERVQEARDDQEEAKDQFKTTLERFSEVVGFDGGDLGAKYRELQDGYERSAAAAEDVSKRIAAVEDVAEDLFAEWESELDQYQSDKLRRSSERQLRETRKRYDQLIAAMRRAEAKMEPVLVAFHDQTLFLKHNLNARAIASLSDTAAALESDVEQLIRDMEASIAEANEFIDSMSGTNG